MFLFDLPRIPHLPQILGSIFACTLYATSEWNMLLLDWSSRRFIFFPLTPRTQGTALSALIPGHLVLTLPVETSAPDSLRIYSLDSLEQIWQPLDDFDVDDPMVLKGVNFMTLVPPPPSLLSTVYHQFADVHVHESPVRAGTYILVVNAKDLVSKDTLPPPSSLFARLRNRFLTRPVTKKTWINTRTLYRLTLPTPSAPVFHRPTPSPTFRWHAKDYRFFTAVAASGYGIRWASAPESMPIHMGSIIFQRLRQGAFEFPRTLPTAVEGDVHDTRSTALHMSETGVVMLRYPAQVVVYWYR
ncbi:hypothetical protein C8R46DRAFT_1116519 [Mycena filopes]|nr:hypothetical protein C8R46DRAFT_1116519 [Mycena filopes]